MIENVTGLLTLRNGETWEKIQEIIATTGYIFSYKVLFAADYGVPQMRKRVFVVGSRWGEPFVFPEPTHGALDDPKVRGRKPFPS